jgi:heme A synthase
MARLLASSPKQAALLQPAGEMYVQRVLWIIFIGLALGAAYGLAWRPAPAKRAAAPPAAPPDLSLKCVALLALVLFQGLLGGATVKYKLPMLVSTAHLATSMIVLLTIIYLARACRVRARLADGLGEPLTNLPRARAAWPLLAVTTTIVYVQIVLGALVRHSGSSEAGGWGLAGAIVPRQAGTGRFILWPAGAPWPLDAQAEINVLHRYVALFVALVVILCCVRCWTLLGRDFTHRRAMCLVWPVVLVIAQIFSGVLMLAVWNVQIYSSLHVGGPAATTIQILARTAHLALGTLLLISLFYPTILAGEAARLSRQSAQPLSAADPGAPLQTS